MASAIAIIPAPLLGDRKHCGNRMFFNFVVRRQRKAETKLTSRMCVSQNADDGWGFANYLKPQSQPPNSNCKSKLFELQNISNRAQIKRISHRLVTDTVRMQFLSWSAGSTFGHKLRLHLPCEWIKGCLVKVNDIDK